MPDTMIFVQIGRQEHPAEKKFWLLTIEPVTGTIPSYVQSSGKIRKKFQKSAMAKNRKIFRPFTRASVPT
jgi:hypothetical protein